MVPWNAAKAKVWSLMISLRLIIYSSDCNCHWWPPRSNSGKRKRPSELQWDIYHGTFTLNQVRSATAANFAGEESCTGESIQTWYCCPFGEEQGRDRTNQGREQWVPVLNLMTALSWHYVTCLLTYTYYSHQWRHLHRVARATGVVLRAPISSIWSTWPKVRSSAQSISTPLIAAI